MLIKASDLKPGDIIVMAVWLRIVLNTKRVAGGVALTVASMGDGCSMHAPEVYDPNHEFEVERAEMTPAQQHGEELREMLWRAANFMRNKPGMTGIEAEARELLATLLPPKPPTAQELAANLAKLANDGILPPLPDYALSLLARARQAGML